MRLILTLLLYMLLLGVGLSVIFRWTAPPLSGPDYNVTIPRRTLPAR